jgi:hypothetical protein
LYTQYSKVLIVGLGYFVAAYFLFQFWPTFSAALASVKELGPITFVLLASLSTLNWGVEIMRWDKALKFKSVDQKMCSSAYQVFYALPYAIVLGKIAGSTAGRLIHFKGSEFKKATKAQILTSLYQSMAVGCFLLGSTTLLYRNFSLFFAGSLLCVLLMFFLRKELIYLAILSLSRTAIIFSSYLVVLNQYHDLELIATLSKTFSVMTFIPFTPLANLGPKEWLMNYFYGDIGLQEYLKAGFVIFVFNNLIPAVVGVIISLAKKWK